MWSGPRNISTAMMRAWENRPDTFVCDEPLYAHYLVATGHTDHPSYDDTIRAHDTDWRRVVKWLTGPIPDGKVLFYQKHMAHHLLPGMDTEWVDSLTNCFLIREPSEMLSSLAEFLPSPTVEETALPQQVELCQRIADRDGTAPPVIDARDVLTDPAAILSELCKRVNVPFYNEMLSWPPGPRDTDGAWAPHWYTKVYNTTSFGTYHAKTVKLPAHLQPVLDQCQPLYEELARHRIQPKVPATVALSD
jgi:hypothetical protein